MASPGTRRWTRRSAGGSCQRAFVCVRVVGGGGRGAGGSSAFAAEEAADGRRQAAGGRYPTGQPVASLRACVHVFKPASITLRLTRQLHVSTLPLPPPGLHPPPGPPHSTPQVHRLLLRRGNDRPVWRQREVHPSGLLQPQVRCPSFPLLCCGAFLGCAVRPWKRLCSCTLAAPPVLRSADICQTTGAGARPVLLLARRRVAAVRRLPAAAPRLPAAQANLRPCPASARRSRDTKHEFTDLKLVEPMPLAEHRKWKYTVHLDGIGCSNRLQKLMATGLVRVCLLLVQAAGKPCGGLAAATARQASRGSSVGSDGGSGGGSSGRGGPRPPTHPPRLLCPPFFCRQSSSRIRP